MFFGPLGWESYKYYTSSPYEVDTALEGYFDEIDVQAQMMRISSWRIHQSLVDKPLKIEEFWPLKTDKIKSVSNDKIVMSPELYAQIKKAHNLN